MNDVFLSYDRSDRAIAQKFADTLEAHGRSVWWDREIPLGKSFDEVIESMLETARCVVVLWSQESVKSRWVKTEAGAAAERDRLVPVLIDHIVPPLEFRRIQAAELWDWDGDPSHPEFQRLLAAIEEIKNPAQHPVVTAPAAAKPRPPRFRIPLKVIAVILLFLVVIAGRYYQNVSTRSSSSPGDSSSGSTQPAGSTTPDSSAPRRGAGAPVAADAVRINIGDKIDDGKPKDGAGNIEKPYDVDTYVFTAKPKQSVYFRIFRHTQALTYVPWKLFDEDGTQVFDTCLGCSDPAVQTLVKGGTYTLTVGGPKDPGTGTYQFQIFDVPAPDQFAIQIGDVIRDGSPGPGAGLIESPGVADIYTFTAKPRQTVYFRSVSRSVGMEQILWRLVDENEMEVFNTCLACSDAGLQTLLRGGKYTLTVFGKANPATGTYRVQLIDVAPPDEINIKIGDRVRSGVPVAGAGRIESPGSQDIYVFTATAGQKVSFRILERSQGIDLLKFKVVDENGMEVFSNCLACSDPGPQTLIRGGKYTMTFGSTNDPLTGTYSFEITPR